MKTHQSRPVVEELQELRAIAAREHGPHAHSTRLIDRALADARQALQQTGCARAAPARSCERTVRSLR